MKDDNIEEFLNIYMHEIPAVFKRAVKDLNYQKQFNYHEERILGVLNCKEKCSMSKLSEIMVLPKSNITIYINNMVEKDLVERFRDENDRRLVLIRLTQKGKDAFQKEIQSKRNEFKKSFSNFRDEDILTLNECGNTIIEIFKKYAEEGGD